MRLTSGDPETILEELGKRAMRVVVCWGLFASTRTSVLARRQEFGARIS
jgi:hypothetical protein